MPLRFRVRAPGQDGGPAVERVVDVGAGGAPVAEIRMGRGPDVELPLPFAALAATHARIRRAPGGGWLVEDLGGHAGTSLGGERLAPGLPRPLRPGASLELGPVELVFDGDVDEPAAAASSSSAGPRPEGTATIARRLVSDLFASAPAAGSTPELEVVAGPEPGQRLVLAEPGRPYLVGRGAGCALPLVVDEISREHAVFVWTGEGVVVRDLGSKNGVLVGGARVAGERGLGHGDLIELGPVTLRLRDPVDRYLAQLAAPPPLSAPPPPAPGAAEKQEDALLPLHPTPVVLHDALPGTSRLGLALAVVAVAVLAMVALAAVVLMAAA